MIKNQKPNKNKQKASSKKKRGKGQKSRKGGALGYGYGQRVNVGVVGVRSNRADVNSSFNPNTMYEMKRASTPGGMRIAGREFFAQTSTSTVGGFTPCTFVATQTTAGTYGPDNGVAIHPNWFVRAGHFAQLYTYYKFHRMKFTFTTTRSFTESGNGVFYIEQDPSLVKATTLNDAIAQLASVMGPVYSEYTLELPSDLSAKAGQSRYKCHYPTGNNWGVVGTTLSPATLSQTVQAVLYGGYFGLVTTGVESVHTIMAEYDVEFYSPQYLPGVSIADNRLTPSKEADLDVEKQKSEWLDKRRDALCASKCPCNNTG